MVDAAVEAGADLDLPSRMRMSEHGDFVLQIGNEPGRSVVVGAPGGKPPFQVGWL
jgi:hypothetical protein